MKTLFLLALTTLVTVPAFANEHNDHPPYTIDMTGKKFVSGNFNTLDDSVSSDFDGLQIKLAGERHKDFELTVQASNARDSICGVTQIWTNHKFTLVGINIGLDVDSGDTCNYTIVYKDGRKAVLTVESTGT